MWSEEMDKKIRAAADNDMHTYDDKSWDGMEILLDKHLPQKKSRRRIIFFLLTALLVVSIPAFLILKYNSSDRNTLSSNNNPAVVQKTGNKSNSQNGTTGNIQTPVSSVPSTNSNSEQVATNTNTAAPSKTINNDQSKPANSPTSTVNPAGNDNFSLKDDSGPKKLIAGMEKKSAANFSTKPGKTGSKTTIVTTQPKPVIQSNPEPAQSKNAITDNNTVTKTTGSEKPSVAATEPAVTPVTKDQPTTDVANAPEQPASTKPTVTTTTETPAKKEKKKGSPASKFFISVSAGPDYSSVASRPGEWRGLYGLGMGYSFSDKWSVRTGFYVARKVYTADSNSYKNLVISSPYTLDYIDANCLVYEVPVNVVYNFANGKKHSWFVSGGLSSYFMKTEKYNYYFKYLSMTQSYSHEYKNENNHLFSVLGLSTGYQYKFNKRLSLMAEPYVRLPLSGVGHGSVKLKSAGAMFTLTYKPFGSK